MTDKDDKEFMLPKEWYANIDMAKYVPSVNVYEGQNIYFKGFDGIEENIKYEVISVDTPKDYILDIRLKVVK